MTNNIDDKKIKRIVEQIIIKEKNGMFEDSHNKTKRKTEALNIIETVIKDETK